MIEQNTDLLWMHIAKHEEKSGVSEIVGDKDNPRILEYHAATKLKATDDETPWCSAFVCWCLKSAGVKSTESAAARSYLRWGDTLLKPVYGCVVVLGRHDDENKNAAHVGFYAGEYGKDAILVLGGNQGNRVCTKSYLKTRVLGYRWPTGVKVPSAE